MATKTQKENAAKRKADKEAAAALPKLVPANSNPAENRPIPSAFDAFSDGVFRDRFTPGLEYTPPDGVNVDAILKAIALCDSQKTHRKHSDAWKWYRGLTKTRNDLAAGKARIAMVHERSVTKLVVLVRKYQTVGAVAMAFGLDDLETNSQSRSTIEFAEKHDPSLKDGITRKTAIGKLRKGEDAYGPQAVKVGSSGGSRADSVEADFD